jgi:hypothetical protein
MDLEEAVARAICMGDCPQWCTYPNCDCAGNRGRQARAAIKAVESYRVPEFRKEGGG